MSLLPRVGRSVGRHSRFLSQCTLSFTSFPHTAILSVAANHSSWCPTKAGIFTSGERLFGQGFRTCAAPLSDSVPVEVPQMGDSISEGSIASILSAGSRVEVDDVIAQIETDKVTLDVRAPVSGTLDAVQVKEGDTVLVGQELGVLKAGEAVVVEAHSSAPATPLPTPAQNHGQGISFPIRRSPEGDRLSSMSTEKAQQILAAMQGINRLPAANSHATPNPGKEERKSDGFASWQPARRGFKRRVLLNSEMEAIMLGGADP